MIKIGKFKRSVLTGILCAAIVLSGVNVFGVENGVVASAATPEEYGKWATTAGAADSTDQQKAEALAAAKAAAVADLKDYYNVLKVELDSATKKKVKKLYDSYVKSIESIESASNVYTSLMAAESALSAAATGTDTETEGTDSGTGDGETTTPTSSSDLIKVGGNWVTPTATYGQTINVVLPIVNMMQGINLNNVVVTPVIAATTSEWPFVIETSGYTQTIADLPGAGNGQSDMDRRRELTWTFKVKDDVLNGYYSVPFLVNYTDPTTGEAVQVTLNTFVLAVGAPGSGNVAEETGKYSTPRVIVTGYETDPKEVIAGSTFTLTLHLKNTSVNTQVSNMLVNITTPTEGTDAETSYAAFMPTSGSNTFYVDKIEKGGTTDLSIEMTAKSDLTQKPYSLDIAMDYEDKNINAYTSNSDISIQVYQNARFELSAPEIMPSEIMVGDQSDIMFSIYNTGKVTLYNVHVSFEGDSIESEETYLGQIESGATGSVDTMVTGIAATADDGTIKAIVTYEDENGESKTYEEEMTLMVSEAAPMDDFDYSDMEEMDEETGSSNVVIIVILVIVGVIIIATVVILVIKKLKKKKEDDDLVNLLDDLEETEGKDDNDEIS